MGIYDLAEILELETRIKNLAGSRFFFGLLVSNYRNDNNERYAWSKPLSKKRMENFKKANKEVLAEDENTVLYRMVGKLFVNKKFGNEWKGKMIYGN